MDRERIRKTAQVALVVVAVLAASGAAFRYLSSRAGDPAVGDGEPDPLAVTPSQGPVGIRPFLEFRGWSEGTTVRVLFCTPVATPSTPDAGARPDPGDTPVAGEPAGPADCAEVASGSGGSRVTGQPIPPTLPGGTEVVPGTYALRAGPGDEPPQVAEFRVVPFELGPVPEPRSYAGVDVQGLGLGDSRAVARGAPCSTHFLPDGRLAIGSTILDPGTGVTVQFPGEGSELRWSPTGERLAIVTADRKEIRMAGPGGEDALTIVREARGLISSVSWAPEGDRLAYVARSEPGVRGGPGPSTLFVFDLVDGSTRELGRAERVAWSPAGGRLAVEAPGGVLELSDLDGGRTRLTEGRRPAWTPDGELVVFLRGVSGEAVGGSWVIRPDGGPPRGWIASGACGTTVSADGERLAVVEAGGELALRTIVLPQENRGS